MFRLRAAQWFTEDAELPVMLRRWRVIKAVVRRALEYCLLLGRFAGLLQVIQKIAYLFRDLGAIGSLHTSYYPVEDAQESDLVCKQIDLQKPVKDGDHVLWVRGLLAGVKTNLVLGESKTARRLLQARGPTASSPKPCCASDLADCRRRSHAKDRRQSQ